MELMYWGGLFLPLVQLKLYIFVGNKNKNRKQSVGGYYPRIQHHVVLSSLLRTKGGIKILTFGMEKYTGLKNLI